MKRIFLIAGMAILFTACNNSGTTDNNTSTDNDTSAPADTTMTMTTTTTTTTYTPAEGDVIYKNGHFMVYKGNDWSDVADDVTLDNGVTIYKNGDAKKEDRTIRLNDGEVITHSGSFIDKTGHAVKDAWGSTKDAVGKAGKAVGDAAGDAGNAVGNAASDAGKAVGKAAKDTKDAVTGDKH